MALQPSNEAGPVLVTTPRRLVSDDQKIQRKNKIYTKVVVVGKAPTGVVKQRREKDTKLSETARLLIQDEATIDAAASDDEDGGDPKTMPAKGPSSRSDELSKRLDVNLLLGSSRTGPRWNREPVPTYFAENSGPIRMVNVAYTSPDAPEPPSAPLSTRSRGPLQTYMGPKKASSARGAQSQPTIKSKDDEVPKFVKNNKLRAIFSGRRFPHAKKAKGMKLK